MQRRKNAIDVRHSCPQSLQHINPGPCFPCLQVQPAAAGPCCSPRLAAADGGAGPVAGPRPAAVPAGDAAVQPSRPTCSSSSSRPGAARRCTWRPASSLPSRGPWHSSGHGGGPASPTAPPGVLPGASRLRRSQHGASCPPSQSGGAPRALCCAGSRLPGWQQGRQGQPPGQPASQTHGASRGSSR